MTDEGRDMRSRRLVLAATVVLVAAVAAVFAAPASSGDREVRRAGVCDGAATSKIKLKAENGRIEVEFEVDQNRNGVPWKVTLRRNGSLVASQTVPACWELVQPPQRVVRAA